MKIFAVGNSFYGDDGVGSVVLERIGEDNLFPGAELFDAHTDALSLVDRLAPGELNVIIDAAHMGLEPGQVSGFRPDEVKVKIQSDHLSMHGFGLAETFAMAGQLGMMPEKVLIVGVEPERIEINCGLSDAVASAVPQVISIIQAEVQSDE
ncbi:MAG: hydrogenase maturation protease [Gemmatimonadales bacterium]|nr:hydrogenase maturation protease [Gemmatimonadales bacterium]